MIALPPVPAWLTRPFAHRLSPTLGAGTGGRLIAGLVAVLVWLATIALATTLLVGDAADRWREEDVERLAVRLPLESDDQARADATAAALAAIRTVPGVGRAEPVPDERLRALLPPTPGPAAGEGVALSLPAVIEVDLAADPSAPSPAGAVGERLRAALPGAAVDSRPSLLRPALRLMRTIEGLAMLTLALLAATLATAVVFATRARLAVQRETIRLLHDLGADDSDVARPLATGAALRVVVGAVVGCLAAAATLQLASSLLATPGDAGPTDLTLPPLAWVGVAALPVVAGLIAAVTARLTVRRALAGLP